MKVLYGIVAAILLGLTAVITTAYFVAPTAPELAEPPASVEQPIAPAVETQIAADDEPTRSPFVESLSIPTLMSYPVHGIAKRASLATLLTETGIQIGAPITIDLDEAKRLGVDFDRVIWFEAPREPGGSRLRALIGIADPYRRFHAAVRPDRRQQIGFHITTVEAADKLALMLVPQKLLALNQDLGLALKEVEPGPVETKPKIQAKVALASTVDLVVRRQREFAESFEGRMLHLAERMGMKLRIDHDSIRNRFTNNPFHWFDLKGFPPGTRPAIDEVQALLDKNSGPLAYAIIRDTADGDTLIITTSSTLTALGPKPTLAMFFRRSPHGTVFEVQRPNSGMLTLSQGLMKRIEGTAREMSLIEALNELAKQAGIDMKVDTPELEALGVSLDTKVMFEPRKREARAVFYDILRQADEEKSGRLVYCYERTNDGKFRLFITSREAALKDGRTIPTDLSFEPDDI